jgi:hexokinase
VEELVEEEEKKEKRKKTPHSLILLSSDASDSVVEKPTKVTLVCIQASTLEDNENDEQHIQTDCTVTKNCPRLLTMLSN